MMPEKDQKEEQPKRGPGRPKTGRSVSMAEYQERHRAKNAAKGIVDFTLRLPVETIEIIKALCESSGKTRGQVIVDLVNKSQQRDPDK